MSRRKRKRRLQGKTRYRAFSWWDKVTYFFAVVVLVAGLFGIVLGVLTLQDVIAFRESAVIAYATQASIFFAFPFLLYLTVTLVAVISSRYNDRVPLFAPRREKRKSGGGRIGLSLWCAGFLLTLCFVPLSLFGRKCMTEEGSFVTYNSFNREVGATHGKSDVSEIVLRTYYNGRGRRSIGKWSYRMVFKMNDEKSFSFDPHNFRWEGEEKLENLILIRDSFSSAHIAVEGADRLDEVIDDMNMDEREAALLRELFAVAG